MFEDIFHAVTFGFFKKKDEPTQPPALVAPPLVADAQGKPQAAAPQAAALAQPQKVENTAAGARIELQSSYGDDGQKGGGRRRRRGSPKNRSKSKNGGSSMGFGRVGGKNKRSSRKKTTYKRRK